MLAATRLVEKVCGCREYEGPDAERGFRYTGIGDLCADHRAEHLAACDARAARTTYADPRAADHEPLDLGTDAAGELWRHQQTSGNGFPFTF